MNITSVKYLFFSYIGYIFSYLIGSLLYGFVASDNNDSVLERLFKKNVVGLWAVTIIFSIIKTTFITINTGLLLITLFWVINNRKEVKLKVTFSFNFIDIFIPFGLITVIYLFEFFTMYNIKKQQIQYYAMDLPVYATFVERMCATNLESCVNTFFSNNPVRNIYHYGDLWLNAFYTTIFNIKAAYSLGLIYPSHTLTIFIIGCIAFFQKIIKKFKLNIFVIFLGLIVPILSGISWYIPRKIGYFNARWQEDYIVLHLIKYIFVGFSIVWCLLNILKKKYNNIPYFVSFSVALYFVSAPGLLLGYFLFICLLYFKGDIAFKNILKTVVPIIITLLYIVVYFLYINSINNKYTLGSQVLYTNKIPITSFLFYKHILSTILDTTIRVIISISGYVLILFIFWKKGLEDKQVLNTLWFILLQISSSIFVFGCLSPLSFEAFQFWLIISTMSLPLLAILTIGVLVNTNKIISYLFIFFIIISSVYNYSDKFYNIERSSTTYNKKFISDIGKEITGKDYKTVVFLAPEQDPNILWPVDRNIHVPLNVLKFYVNNYQPICLSVYEIDTNISNKTALNSKLNSLYSSVFYNFVEKQKINNNFSSISQSQVDFIKTFKVKYLIITPNSKVSPLITSYISKRIIDTISKDEFCYLKY